jgi:origin recognition complex subunit 5
LVVELSRLLQSWAAEADTKHRFVLVFDGVDHQRDAPPTLLPALARLGEVVRPSFTPFLHESANTTQIPNLTTLFIVTFPRPSFLHTPGVPHLPFPPYTKPELLQILSLSLPHPVLPTGEKDTKETYTRFCTAVHDSLSKHSGRDVLSFRRTCLLLWPRFIRPILSGELSPTPFSRLLLANRSLFQDESALVPRILLAPNQTTSNLLSKQSNNAGTRYQSLTSLLPHTSRLLLVASYLASFNPPRLDSTLFMRAALTKRRKKGGGTALTRISKTGQSKSRKISRKLLGPQAFVLERMLAIFHAIREEGKGAKGRGMVNGSADIQMAVATLGSLRLLVRVGSAASGDALDGGCRYRAAVGWEVVRGVARSVGVEVEDYLAD